MFLSEELKAKKIDELHNFIDRNCIFRCDPEVKYVDGLEKGTIPTDAPTKSNAKYQFYLKNLTYNPIMLTHVCALFLDDLLSKMKKNEEYNTFQLCGIETSSIPIITGIQMCAIKLNININSFIIRKNRKNYGLFNFVDGKPTDAPVIFVDDLFNSGNSIYKCYEVCKYELGLIPAKNLYCIIKFEKHALQVNCDENLINIFNIFTKDDFNYEYDPDKYWLPKDCDKTINKRPEYF